MKNDTSSTHMWGRTALFSFISLVVSVSGHSLSTGEMPDPVVFGLSAIATIVVAVALLSTKVKATLTRTAFFIIALQFFVHIISGVASHHNESELIPSPNMISFHVIASIIAAIVFSYGNFLITLWCQLWRQLLVVLRIISLPNLVRIAAFREPLLTRSHAIPYTIWHRGPPLALQN